MGIARNLLNGAGRGAALVLDPVGASINTIDYLVHGVAPGSDRRLRNLHSAIHHALTTPEELSLGGYVARGVGYVGGVAVAGAVGFAALTSAPLAALGLPVGAGVVAIGRGLYQGGTQFFRGEDGAKTRFWQAFKNRYHRVMNFDLVEYGHTIDSLLSGRDIDQSAIESTVKEQGPVRRNAANYFGQAAGLVAGLGTYAGLFVVGTTIAGPLGGLLAAAAIPIRNLYRGVRNTARRHHERCLAAQEA